ncbi:group XII secretory phospholipase A2 precursor (PLA2G12) [Archangium gephyra]|uniref:Group XII secretory phospholipase A2 (PLA2G12) n=1 Tax=Archangium gephyra TaxID=48 RepID=A0ABX9JQK2_9BACT|nr:hypothetical protein [Archangium gephyra]REG24507.1 group XII secretory phospholipase A2 precursor (PLA2G12) [Archangium gephyra]
MMFVGFGLGLHPPLAWGKSCENPIVDLAKCAHPTPHPGWDPSIHHNGCGAEGGVSIADEYGKAHFLAACNSHDTCYNTCNASKATCDEQFRKDLRATCKRAFPLLIETPQRRFCLLMAEEYKLAVVLGGKNAYEDGQKEACECCLEERFYCPCQKTCFDDIAACTGACDASLSCYSDICAVAQPGQCNQ